jgi:hypothetical protein
MPDGFLQSDEYHERRLDYLSGAVDVMAVYASLLATKTDASNQPLNAPLMSETFMGLFSDTNEQLKNLVNMLKQEGDDAQSNNAVDD